MANLLDENEVNPYILAPGMIAAGTGDPENEVATPRRGVFDKDQSAYTPPGIRRTKTKAQPQGISRPYMISWLEMTKNSATTTMTSNLLPSLAGTTPTKVIILQG